MGRIRVLDDVLVNRIAAGEVVERPASVVKELIENSLDAAATRIDVELLAGGKRSIRVHDDGHGMDRDDALLALERHATSKLRGSEDLRAIRTLGFRGEALPSIAAVSRFVLRTTAVDAEGTEVEVRGGRIQAVREIGHPRGTWVEVAGLFFNLPARRKFLRSTATELSHTLRLLSRCALAHPEVLFRLVHDGRSLVDAVPAGDRRERIAQLYGGALAEKLLEFTLSRGGARATGFAGRPTEALPRRHGQHVFVNGRPVQDRILGHALSEAYADTVPRGRHPAVFLFLDIDPEKVDVNVHPQKGEVRFSDGDAVHDLVRDAVAGALAQGAAVPSYGHLRPHVAPASTSEAVVRFLELREAGDDGPAGGRPGSSVSTLREPRNAALAFATGDGTKQGDRSVAEPLVQYRDSYVVAEDEQGILLVDQHAAHERVLFERFLEDVEKDQASVQRLMFPVMVELAPHEQVVLEEEAEEFARLGFVVEPFGGNTVRVDGVPSVAGDLDPVALLRELLGEASRTRAASSGVAELRRRLVTSAACQAAIKIHHPLARDEMRRLLDDLFRSANPTTCPHGRPTVFRLTLEEIERAFRRR